MEEYRKTSFLKELASNVYQYFSDLKIIALLYAALLVVMVVLSLFWQSDFIKFFIDCMMGWTLLSIPFVAIMVVALDKEFTVSDSEFSYKIHHKEPRYIFSAVWGIALCIAGLVTLYYSNDYKKYYAFQCQDFYLEETTGVYHIKERCDYIGIDDNDESVENPSIIKIRGRELLDTDYELCAACEEWAEEAEAEAATYQYRRP